MNFALYLNGVFEEVLEEIRKAQADNPGLVCYLQPYASDTIVKLLESPPTLDSSVTLYISLTSSLSFVFYRAEIVGWENKFELSSDRLSELNTHIQQYQPNEEEIYMIGGNEKPSINLISVTNVERLETPIPVSSFIKLSNQTPLKPRSTSGRWSYVKTIPQWVGTLSQTVVQEELFEELEKAVKASLASSESERKNRLSTASALPDIVQIISKGYRRNPDVVASVLYRAKGICEQCGSNAPFKRASDGSPYLEVHHRLMLSQGGEDTVENSIAVCPNCHRDLHFGMQS